MWLLNATQMGMNMTIQFICAGVTVHLQACASLSGLILGGVAGAASC